MADVSAAGESWSPDCEFWGVTRSATISKLITVQQSLVVLSFGRKDRRIRLVRRRSLIAVLGGAVTWPFTARAQQRERMRRIGVLPASASDSEYPTLIGAFLQELQQLGWALGRNLQMEIRWGGGNVDLIRKDAVELAGLAPDVISRPAPPPQTHSCRRAAPCRSYSRSCPIPSGPGSSAVCTGRAETPPGLPASNMASAANGLS
jgi:hypothetical protein